jgi:hypothetical protein
MVHRRQVVAALGHIVRAPELNIIFAQLPFPEHRPEDKPGGSQHLG